MIQATTGQVSTTTDAAITLLAAANRHQLTVVNFTAAACWVSLDSGTNWFYMPAAPTGAVTARTWTGLDALPPMTVQAKRLAGQSNVTLSADCI